MQQSPMNDANTLMPIAPPVVVAICFSSFTSATALAKLDRWAFNRAIRAVNAAVAGQWAQDFTAALAVIKELAGIGWHGLRLLMATSGTFDYGPQFNGLVRCAGHGWTHLLIVEVC